MTGLDIAKTAREIGDKCNAMLAILDMGIPSSEEVLRQEARESLVRQRTLAYLVSYLAGGGVLVDPEQLRVLELAQAACIAKAKFAEGAGTMKNCNAAYDEWRTEWKKPEGTPVNQGEDKGEEGV
jgi:hypothetical protein